MKTSLFYGVATLCLALLAAATESSLNCSDGSCDEDEAPCPPDSRPELGPDGGPCVCQMKHCAQTVCRYGSRSVLKKTGSKKPGDCCDIYECEQPREKNCSEIVCPEDVECPQDSYRLPSHKAPSDCCSVGLGCQCLPGPCPAEACPEGEHARVVRPGSGKPGACCPVFECLNHDSNDTCILLDGKVTQNGTEWLKDECTLCKCNNGLLSCSIWPPCPDIGDDCPNARTQVGDCCPVCADYLDGESIPGGCWSANENIYQNGESWQEDACTMCECKGGEKKCQAYMCEVMCVNPKYVAGECCPLCDATSVVTLPPNCPSFNNCSLRCVHGFKRDEAGCFTCQCQAEQCLLECPNGYSQDVNGNKLCKCDNLSKKSTQVVCPPLTGCRKNCSHGYRLNKAGCEVCKCKQCTPMKDCHKNCPHGFITNDRNCEICKCRVSVALSTPLRPEEVEWNASSESCVVTNLDTVRTYDDGDSWFDGCRQCYCHAGVEMCNLITCPVAKCPNPVFNSSSDCCPSCQEAMLSKENHLAMYCQSVDGVYRVEGETWLLNNCTQCLCHAGRVLCQAKSCSASPCLNPVLSVGECCSTCPQLESPHGAKCSTGDVHSSMWKETICRSCVCDDGRVNCFEERCPSIKCDRPVYAKKSCCPMCLDVTMPKSCRVANVTYHADETWNEDACTHCVCRGGVKFCTEKVCSVSCDNPVKKPGKCCPTCKLESPSLFKEGMYQGAIIVLAFILVCLAAYIARPLCRRSQQMNLKNTSYANYSTDTPPPQYASADRRDPFQYKFVQSYDTNQIDDILKSPSIGVTEKMALAPV